jgi:WD40 repeat protein
MHEIRAQLVTLQGHTANVTSLAWQNEAKWLVSGSEDGTVKIWDVRSVSKGHSATALSEDIAAQGLWLPFLD